MSVVSGGASEEEPVNKQKRKYWRLSGSKQIRTETMKRKSTADLLIQNDNWICVILKY